MNDRNKESLRAEIMSLPFSDEMPEADRKLVGTLGSQAYVWAFGCDREILDDIDGLAREMEQYVADNGMTVRDKLVTEFEPQGVTIVLVLEESHLLLNTWPEHNVLQVELFSCKDIDRPALYKIIKDGFKADRIYFYNLE